MGNKQVFTKRSLWPPEKPKKEGHPPKVTSRILKGTENADKGVGKTLLAEVKV